MNQPQPLRNAERVERMQANMRAMRGDNRDLLGCTNGVTCALIDGWMVSSFEEFDRLAYEATAEL